MDFELDLLESLGRNRVVARRLTVADGHVAFDKTPMGWQLRGASGTGGFDLRALMTHSDEVWLRGRIGLYGESLAGTVRVESMLINQDGNHRFHIGLQTDAGCPDCALTIDGDITDDGPGAVRIAGESVVVARDLVELAGLGPLFADANGKRVGTDLGVDCVENGRRGTLETEAGGQPRGSSGASAQVGLEAEAWRDGGSGYRGRVGSLTLASRDAVFRLDHGGFVVRPGVREAELWLPTFALDSLARPLAEAFGTEHALGRNIDRLTPRARISALGVHVDARGWRFRAAYPRPYDRTQRCAGSRQRGVLVRRQPTRRARIPRQSRCAVGVSRLPDGLRDPRRGDRLAQRSSTTANTWPSGTDMSSRADAATGSSRSLARVGTSLPRHRRWRGQPGRVDTARGYVPTTLSPELRKWLLDNVQAGELAGARMVYQGRTTVDDDLPWRRFEMSARFANATVAYHADWPTATNAEGEFVVTPRRTRMRGQARAFGVHLPDLEVSVRHESDGGARADNAAAVGLSCETTVPRLFDFARATPIRDALPFLSDTWSGDGKVSVTAQLRIPLGDRPLNPGDVSADFVFDDAGLDLADIGLGFVDINERVHFEYPANLASNALEGSLFGAPVTIGISSDTDSVSFKLTGSATPQDAYRLLDVDDLGIADGRFRYDALFTVFPNSDRAMELQVTSDLEGVAVRLPAPLAKSADDIRPMTAAMQFLDSHVAVAARYGEADGWLHTDDGGVRAGAIGIGGGVPMIDAAEGRVVLGGGVHEIGSETMAVLLAPSADVDRQFAWELRRFSVGRMTLDDFTVADAVLDGFADGGEVSFAIDAGELKGTIAKSGDSPWRVKLSELRLPAHDGEGDPLTMAAMDRLLAADVELDRVIVGDEDYGSWKLGLRPDANGVTLTNVVADVRRLHIESGRTCTGPGVRNRFDARSPPGPPRRLDCGGFAPSVESEPSSLGSVRWPEVAINFDLARLRATPNSA